MSMPKGVTAFQSSKTPTPLTEEEEALLAFAACGITDFAYADLCFEPGQGGSIIANFVGRTVPSGDAANTVSLIVTNDEATYWMKRPQDMAPAEVAELVALAKENRFLEAYQRSRVKIADRKLTPSTEPPINLDVNQWSLYAKGSTYFLPIQELTYLYINALLEIFNESLGYFVIDERNGFKPAGLARFAKSKGGHLNDSPSAGKTFTIQGLDGVVSEFVATEQGMVVQNLCLMASAMGLGGFPHYAAHPFGWFQALGFRSEEMSIFRFLGLKPSLAKVLTKVKKGGQLPVPIGLEVDGKVQLKTYRPPYFASMRDAVQALVDDQFGPNGRFRANFGGWAKPHEARSKAAPPSEKTIDAVVAYCDYVFSRYGRFPAYPMPLKTTLGFQAGRVEEAFYDEFYAKG